MTQRGFPSSYVNRTPTQRFYRDGEGSIPKKQNQNRDGDDDVLIPWSPSPPVLREAPKQHPAAGGSNDPDYIYASQEAAGPNTSTSIDYCGPQQLHGGDAVPPQDHTMLESLDGEDQAPQRSSQSYPDIEGYGEVDADGWNEVDTGLEQVCAANEHDLTLLRSFDPRARVVNWSSGHKTFLPWLSFDDIGVKNERAIVSLSVVLFFTSNRTHAG